MKLSVIIPTRDRANLLADCLASISAQSRPTSEFEVLVIDNGSSDDTVSVAKRFSETLPMRVIDVPEPGLHLGRHAGLKAATGEILVFADDDIIADESWLRSIEEAFSDASIVLVGGNNLPLFEVEPPDWVLRWWDLPVGNGRALSLLSVLDFGEGQFDIDPQLVWGCNFSIRRSTLVQAGGFHPDAMPIDRLRFRGDGETAVSKWIRSHGLKARFHSGATVWHRVASSRTTPEYFESRSYAQGISDSYTDLRQHRTRSQVLARCMRSMRARIAFWKSMWRAGGDSAGNALRHVRRRCLSAYLAGYAYHQREVARDPALLAWVMQEHYLA